MAYSREKQETKAKNYLLSLRPRLIFIDECKKIKLFICLDKAAVKNYRGKSGNTDPDIIWTPSDFSNMKNFRKKNLHY